MSNDTLASCPFCGEQPRIKRWDGGEDAEVWCANDKCGVAPASYGLTQDDAIAAWNRRAPAQGAIPGPDWGQAPEWAMWWAVNADLEAFWYAFKPFPLTNLTDACWQWSDDDEFKRIRSAGEAVLPIGIDWRTTLSERPQGQEDSHE